LYTNNLLKSVKTRFFNQKYTLTICVGSVWVVIAFFLLEKQTFNGLLKIIGVQIPFQNINTDLIKENNSKCCAKDQTYYCSKE
jgi:hypothetical protein